MVVFHQRPLYHNIQSPRVETKSIHNQYYSLVFLRDLVFLRELQKIIIEDIMDEVERILKEELYRFDEDIESVEMNKDE